MAKLEHKVMILAHTTRKVARQAAREQGLPPEHIKRVSKILAVADFIGSYATSAGGLVVGGAIAGKPGAVVGKLLGMGIPIGSAAYLAYSTARNPMATIRAAQKLVKGAIHEDDLEHHSRDQELSNAALLLDSISQQWNPDWYTALLHAGLDHTGGDVPRAVRIADFLTAHNPQAVMPYQGYDEQAELWLYARDFSKSAAAVQDTAPNGRLAWISRKTGKVLKYISSLSQKLSKQNIQNRMGSVGRKGLSNLTQRKLKWTGDVIADAGYWTSLVNANQSKRAGAKLANQANTAAEHLIHTVLGGEESGWDYHANGPIDIFGVVEREQKRYGMIVDTKFLFGGGDRVAGDKINRRSKLKQLALDPDRMLIAHVAISMGGPDGTGPKGVWIKFGMGESFKLGESLDGDMIHQARKIWDGPMDENTFHDPRNIAQLRANLQQAMLTVDVHKVIAMNKENAEQVTRNEAKEFAATQAAGAKVTGKADAGIDDHIEAMTDEQRQMYFEKLQAKLQATKKS
ncbi:hypothetical protein [Tuwongella immobilis]|uniref:hypothetical protein n=1 Tax=Tuwongella immobilis TaxID=692036 RepID=UPI0013A6F87E|nr:hypothetical protein [Tuwongella immobilis]